MKLFLSAVLLFFISFFTESLAENTGKLVGVVRDKKTNEPLTGATVAINGTKWGAGTDNHGYYFILNIPPGVYEITASFIGYGKQIITDVRIKIDKTTTLNIELNEISLQTKDIIIIAEKPKVELDQTASKESLSKDEIANAWAGNVKDLISDLAGTNMNGGIRGSFGNDVSFRMDGLDMRDIGSNTNYTGVNMSTIQEIEVLTGGWNAEYGQANGSIVNIVSKKAEDRIHALYSYKFRPAGLYHWGRNFYGGENDPFSTVMTTPEFWDPTKEWKTPWMETPRKGYDGGNATFQAMTPQQRADWWKKFISDQGRFPQTSYTSRQEWEQEVTVYGPVIPGLGFLLSGRYKEGVQVYPSVLKFNPDWTVQGSLDWVAAQSTKFSLNGLFTKFINSGQPRTYYQSSETTAGGDLIGQQLPIITDPYSDYRYWMFGTKGGSDKYTIRPPEKADLFNVQLKWTEVFDASTFLEVALQHSQTNYAMDFSDISRTASFPTTLMPSYKDSSILAGTPPKSFWDPSYWGIPGDTWKSWADNRNTSIKADLTSQIDKHHLLKTGFIFSLQRFSKTIHEGGLAAATPFIQINDIIPMIDRPYEGALYAQDKIELGGMVVNAGLRVDFFNANKTVSANIFDPYMLSDSTVGHTGPVGHVSYDPNGSGPGYVKTPLRIAVSPRLGISHPITETTVLHFMFGVFNQRPAWTKILSNPVVYTNKLPSDLSADMHLSDTTRVTYRYYGQKVGNPALTWEKMTQYEVGFEQNIANMFSLDVTMYYKDAYNLTSIGIAQGPGSSGIQESGGSVDVRLYGDPYKADGQTVGTNIRNFTTTVNGAWADVRGIEVKLGSRFEWFNFDLNYNLSFLVNGSYHFNKMFQEFANGIRRGEDVYEGASNTDNGGIGNNDQRWNPNNSAVLKLHLTTPPEYGPEFEGIYPLGGWSISSSTRWSQGEEFTWYPDDYTGYKEPLNRNWEDSWNTNLNINKSFELLNRVKLKFFIQITNLFNEKNLKYISSETSRNLYMQQGKLPFNSTTGEPLEWSWYSNLPRQIYFGTSVEF